MWQVTLPLFILLLVLWIGLFFLMSLILQVLYNNTIPIMNEGWKPIGYWTAVLLYLLILLFFFGTHIYKRVTHIRVV